MRDRDDIIALAGYAVASPRTPADAPALFATEHFDLVVIGNSMAEEERNSIVRELRKINSTVPIVCVASNEEKMPGWADHTVKESDSAETLLKSIRDCPTSSRTLDANPHISGVVQFAPDGKGVAYPIREKGVDNVWVQPLDGSAEHQIAQFTSDQINSFHWSPDGKNLAVLRSHSESDVILLQESKP